jgi:hypothetical protein
MPPAHIKGLSHIWLGTMHKYRYLDQPVGLKIEHRGPHRRDTVATLEDFGRMDFRESCTNIKQISSPEWVSPPRREFRAAGAQKTPWRAGSGLLSNADRQRLICLVPLPNVFRAFAHWPFSDRQQRSMLSRGRINALLYGRMPLRKLSRPPTLPPEQPGGGILGAAAKV